MKLKLPNSGGTSPATFLNFKKTFSFDIIGSFRLYAPVEVYSPLHPIPEVGKSINESAVAYKATKKNSYERKVTEFIHSSVAL
jgi:hypothetical protein